MFFFVIKHHKLRQANLNDLDEMQTLFVDTIKSTCKKDYNQAQIEAWATSVNNKDGWKSFLTNQFFLIAEIDEEMVGYGSLENGNYLDFMYVHKDFLRRGVASFLYENLRKESIRLGFDKLTSDVSKTALPFFETKGFKVVRENKNLINGVGIVNYRMSH